MAGYQIPKWLKHRRVPLFMLLSVLSLGATLWIPWGYKHWSKINPIAPSPPVAIGLTSPSPVSPSVSPSASREVVGPSPLASPTPATKRSTVGKVKAEQAEAEPALTPEQQAEQQKAIAELEASIPTVDSLLEMQVAIEVDISAVTFGVSTDAPLLDENGDTLDTLVSGTPYTAQADGESMLINGVSRPALVWVEPPVGGLFYLGDRAYRGRLLLAVENGKLWVVNFVSMRNYLYSVVASEVSPSWNVEALKAQAVAARSYAMTYYFNPVNDLYHLGDDEYFQVYSGMATEDDRVRKAVDATAGEFVSYHGGVVESLYAASDEIVKEAFQGRGMSQLGALGLAERGYTYEQILTNYYPDTSVGRIEQDF